VDTETALITATMLLLCMVDEVVNVHYIM